MLIPCRDCDRPISVSARWCVHCGARDPALRPSRWMAILPLGVLVAGAVEVFAPLWSAAFP